VLSYEAQFEEKRGGKGESNFAAAAKLAGVSFPKGAGKSRKKMKLKGRRSKPEKAIGGGRKLNCKRGTGIVQRIP